MGEKTSRAKLSVALVGVGPTWELHYRDAIQNLSSKLSVRTVCDSVHMRAAAVADEYEATAVSCPWLLTQRKDLHAWLILDPVWFDIYPAALSVRHGCPALFANTFSSSIPSLTPILRRSLEQGETLMPEFPQRFMPATTRLRELMATKLGRVRRIEISIPLSVPDSAAVTRWLHENHAEFIGLLDWCGCLIDDSSSHVTFRTTSTGSQFDLRFPVRASDPQDVPEVTILFDNSGEFRRHIFCDRGSAVISSPTQIAWKTKTEHADESLSHERSPYEIILDQFCRRALGGLVPVPTLNHALQAITTYRLALQAISEITTRDNNAS